MHYENAKHNSQPRLSPQVSKSKPQLCSVASLLISQEHLLGSNSHLSSVQQ